MIGAPARPQGDGSWELDPVGRYINVFLVLLISANVATVILGSVESIATRFQVPFYRFNVLSVAIFSVEYAARLRVCVESPRSSYRQPLKGRLRYAMSPMAIIDFLAIAPFYVAFFVPTVDLRYLRVFRVFRLLKLSRYFPALHTIGDVVGHGDPDHGRFRGHHSDHAVGQTGGHLYRHVRDRYVRPASGHSCLRIHIGDTDHHLYKGDFFGEIALLHGRKRMGTAIGETSCRLLVLDRTDFEALCERNPNIHDRVKQVAENRLEDAANIDEG